MFRTIALMLGLYVFAMGEIGNAAEDSKVVAEGEWSKSVVDKDGYAVRGRLVLCEKAGADDRRKFAVYVEIQDASDFISSSGMQLYCDMGRNDFRPEYKGGLRCEMLDKDQKIIESRGFPFGGAVPLSEWVRLPVDATIRLRSTPFGISGAKVMAISPGLNQMWEIADGDASEYFLSGTFTIDPAADRVPIGEGHVWRGTIELPAMKIVNITR